MIASQIEASTRSEATSISALRPVVPFGRRGAQRLGHAEARARRARTTAPLTAWARTFVSRPAP